MLEQATQEFAVAPRGAILVLITGFSLMLCVGMPLGFAIGGLFGEPTLLPGALVTLCGSIAFAAVLARPCIIRAHRVTNAQIVVSHPSRDRVFERSKLTSAEIDPDATRNTFVMPNSGYFLFGGRPCRSSRLGRFEAYADHRHTVVLRFGEQEVVLTPQDPARFVAAVRP